MLSKICNKKNLILLFLILVLFIIIYLKFLSKQKEYFTNEDGEVQASPNSKMEPEATVDNGFSDYREINTDNAEHQYGLRDYYIKTAYNACSNFENTTVSIDFLKNNIKRGIRCLDFEIYSDISDQPILYAPGKEENNPNEKYCKRIDPETANSVLQFLEVLEYLKGDAYSPEECTNYTDPLILHFRFKSNAPLMYINMANMIMQHLGSSAEINRLMPPNYGYQYAGNPVLPSKNIGSIPLPMLKNKILIFVDDDVCCWPQGSEGDTKYKNASERAGDNNTCKNKTSIDSCPCKEDYFSWQNFPYSENNEILEESENNFHEIVNAAGHTKMLWVLKNSLLSDKMNGPNTKPETIIHNSEFMCFVKPDIDSEIFNLDVRNALDSGAQMIAMNWESSNNEDIRRLNIQLLEQLHNNLIHEKVDLACEDNGYIDDNDDIDDDFIKQKNSCYLKTLYACNSCELDKKDGEDDEESEKITYECIKDECDQLYFAQESAFILKPDHLRYKPVLLEEPVKRTAAEDPQISSNNTLIQEPGGVYTEGSSPSDNQSNYQAERRMEFKPDYNNNRSSTIWEHKKTET